MAVPLVSSGQIPNQMSHAKSQVSKIKIFNLHWKLEYKIDQKTLISNHYHPFIKYWPYLPFADNQFV